MTLDEAAKTYWLHSQRYFALPEDERESYLTFIIHPIALATESQVVRKRLLSLIDRERMKREAG